MNGEELDHSGPQSRAGLTPREHGAAATEIDSVPSGTVVPDEPSRKMSPDHRLALWAIAAGLVAAVIAGASAVAGSVVGARMQQDASRDQVEAQTAFDQQKLLREQRIATISAFIAAVEDEALPYAVTLCQPGTANCPVPTAEELAADQARQDREAAVVNAYIAAMLYASDDQLELLRDISDLWRARAPFYDERSALLDSLRKEAQFASMKE